MESLFSPSLSLSLWLSLFLSATSKRLTGPTFNFSSTVSTSWNRSRLRAAGKSVPSLQASATCSLRKKKTRIMSHRMDIWRAGVAATVESVTHPLLSCVTFARSGFVTRVVELPVPTSFIIWFARSIGKWHFMATVLWVKQCWNAIAAVFGTCSCWASSQLKLILWLFCCAGKFLFFADVNNFTSYHLSVYLALLKTLSKIWTGIKINGNR